MMICGLFNSTHTYKNITLELANMTWRAQIVGGKIMKLGDFISILKKIKFMTVMSVSNQRLEK